MPNDYAIEWVFHFLNGLIHIFNYLTNTFLSQINVNMGIRVIISTLFESAQRINQHIIIFYDLNPYYLKQLIPYL